MYLLFLFYHHQVFVSQLHSTFTLISFSMSISGIHDQLLEVTVAECRKLKDTEWLSRQDPYVILTYGNKEFRTTTCTDGDKNPTFQEKFVINLIEGLREIKVVVWNSNTITNDDFIGSGKVPIQDVLSRGYDDRAWTLQTKSGRYAGEIKLIMHYAHAKDNKPTTSVAAEAPVQAHQPMYAGPMVVPMSQSYQTPGHPPVQAHQPMYMGPMVVPMTHSYQTTVYPPPPPPSVSYPAPPSVYPPRPQPLYPEVYPPVSYPPPPTHSSYPPTHPPPPPPAGYPPHSYPQASSCSHSGFYPGVYPPHPY